MNGNGHEIKAFCLWHIGCFTQGVRLIHYALLVATAVLMAALTACGAPGDLQAGLEGPSVEISSDQHWQELAFVARAQTSAPLVGAEVRVRAACDLPARMEDSADAGAGGQVRVMLARDALEQDHGRGENVLPLDDGAEVLVPRPAFDACEGDCEDTFVIVFSAEGIPEGVTVEMPIHIEATLSYEGEAPAEDSVALELINEAR